MYAPLLLVTVCGVSLAPNCGALKLSSIDPASRSSAWRHATPRASAPGKVAGSAGLNPKPIRSVSRDLPNSVSAQFLLAAATRRSTSPERGRNRSKDAGVTTAGLAAAGDARQRDIEREVSGIEWRHTADRDQRQGRREREARSPEDRVQGGLVGYDARVARAAAVGTDEHVGLCCRHRAAGSVELRGLSGPDDGDRL